jgi:hypothetical protein
LLPEGDVLLALADEPCKFGLAHLPLATSSTSIDG